MKRVLTALASDKPLVAATAALTGAVLASLGLADLSSSAVTVIDGAAGLILTTYVGGSAHVAATTAKAAATTAAAPPPSSTVQADIAQVLKNAAEALTAPQG